MNNDDKIGDDAVECRQITRETVAAGDTPSRTDVFSDNGFEWKPSFRWLWRPTTWFLGLALLATIVVVQEFRTLRAQGDITDALSSRGYIVIDEPGWLRRTLPQKWRPQSRLLGDRTVGIQANLRKQELKSIDDLVPQIRAVVSVKTIHFGTPGGFVQGLPTPIESIRQFLSSLKDTGRVDSVNFLYFHESQFPEEFMDCLKTMDFERVSLQWCDLSEVEFARLQTLPKLKMLELSNCVNMAKALHHFKTARPDVSVREISPITSP